MRVLVVDTEGVRGTVNRGLRGTGRRATPIEAISAADFPRASTPPAFGALANNRAAALGVRLRHWEEALAELLVEGGAGPR